MKRNWICKMFFTFCETVPFLERYWIIHSFYSWCLTVVHAQTYIPYKHGMLSTRKSWNYLQVKIPMSGEAEQRKLNAVWTAEYIVVASIAAELPSRDWDALRNSYSCFPVWYVIQLSLQLRSAVITLRWYVSIQTYSSSWSSERVLSIRPALLSTVAVIDSIQCQILHYLQNWCPPFYIIVFWRIKWLF